MSMSVQRACSLRPAELGHSRAGIRSAACVKQREHLRLCTAASSSDDEEEAACASCWREGGEAQLAECLVFFCGMLGGYNSSADAWLGAVRSATLPVMMVHARCPLPRPAHASPTRCASWCRSARAPRAARAAARRGPRVERVARRWYRPEGRWRGRVGVSFALVSFRGGLLYAVRTWLSANMSCSSASACRPACLPACLPAPPPPSLYVSPSPRRSGRCM